MKTISRENLIEQSQLYGQLTNANIAAISEVFFLPVFLDPCRFL
jgi:hypothetical protein